MALRKKFNNEEDINELEKDDSKKNAYGLSIWTIIHLVLTVLFAAGTAAFFYEQQLNSTMVDKVSKYDALLEKYDSVTLQLHQQQTHFHDMEIKMEKLVSDSSPLKAIDTPPCKPCDYSKCFRKEDCPKVPNNAKLPNTVTTDNELQTKQLQLLTKKSDLLMKKIIPMQSTIQLLSKQQLIHKYGEKPYIVDISVSLPTSSDVIEIITIELAPISLMPYTILYFLNQIENKAWDGCAFMRNARHVIQAGVTSIQSESKDRICKHQNFMDAQAGVSDSIVFQEYSEQFPHKRYTIGLAVRYYE